MHEDNEIVNEVIKSTKQKQSVELKSKIPEFRDSLEDPTTGLIQQEKNPTRLIRSHLKLQGEEAKNNLKN